MRRRLTLLVAATMTLVLVAFLVPLALLLRNVARDQALATATNALQGLLPVVGTADPDPLRLSVEQVSAAAGRPVTVFLGDGTVLGTQVPRSTAVDLAARGRSLTVGSPAGREIVVAVQGRPEGTAVVRTFVTAAELTKGVSRAWLTLATLAVALLLLGLVVADRLARALVRPITDLSAVSHRLARAELTARATPAGPPELREVAGALNQLAGRIQELLREEREHVADLSHRLRTPLTSLRLEAESLADPGEAARIGATVDGLERAVTGLIQQARRKGAAGGGVESCDAAAVVRDRVAFWAVLAEDTGRLVTLDLAPGPLPVQVAADDLAAALDALLGNVFAHTPDGTAFTVSSSSGPPVEITVADEGPGLAPGGVERGTSGGGSTGLGLDIARRAAETGGGDLTVVSPPDGGTAVTVHLSPGTHR